jgi:hypothetical protein
MNSCGAIPLLSADAARRVNQKTGAPASMPIRDLMVVKLGNHHQVNARTRHVSQPIERAKALPTLNHAVIQATNMVHGSREPPRVAIIFPAGVAIQPSRDDRFVSTRYLATLSASAIAPTRMRLTANSGRSGRRPGWSHKKEHTPVGRLTPAKSAPAARPPAASLPSCETLD